MAEELQWPSRGSPSTYRVSCAQYLRAPDLGWLLLLAKCCYVVKPALAPFRQRRYLFFLVNEKGCGRRSLLVENEASRLAQQVGAVERNQPAWTGAAWGSLLMGTQRLCVLSPACEEHCQSWNAELTKEMMGEASLRTRGQARLYLVQQA